MSLLPPFPRLRVPELMDDPGADRAELAGALRYLRFVNRWWGGHATLLGQLQRWSVAWPKGSTITLLDIATGSADLPIAACQWAKSRGFTLNITATDIHAATLNLAREQVAAAGLESLITLRNLNATRLTEHYGFEAFDYVHAGLFLHHLPEIEVLTVLRIMDRLARRGLLWNDLIRSRPGLWFITLATLFAEPMPKHDARASVRAAFTRREVLTLAQRAGIERPEYRAFIMTHRFALSTTKPGRFR